MIVDSLQPLVSVIVPNYNHEKFLPARLDSIFHQTYQHIEVIALDDASTDGSRRVLEEYAKKFPMRLVYNQRNTGSPFLQWKRAAALARGQLLWIAESDDVASPLLLETLVRALMLNPLAGLAYCQSLRMDRNGDLGESFTHWTDDLDPLRWRQDYTNRGRDEICRFMIRRNIVPNASAVVVRKDLLIAAVEGAEKFRFAGDWLTWAKVLCQTDIIFVSAALNFFRTHQDSVRDTIKLTQACAERLAVVNAICRAMAVPRAARCQAFYDGFGLWKSCFKLNDFQIHFRWLWITYRSAGGIYPSAWVKMPAFLLQWWWSRLFISRTAQAGAAT